MYQVQRKSNSAAMIMLANVINHALELAGQQDEQDAQIIKKAERYADETGMALWNGGW